jgi:hypothetical protein
MAQEPVVAAEAGVVGAWVRFYPVLVLVGLLMVAVGKSLARGDRWPLVMAEAGGVLAASFTPSPLTAARTGK